MDKLYQSYKILESLRLPHGLYLAAPSNTYSYVWLRDSFYCSLPFLNRQSDVYEKTYHRFLDLFIEYQWKIKYHTKHKPIEQWEFIHARYDAETVKEINVPWGHAQNDSIGAILFGIGQGIKVGKNILRDDKDIEIVQLLVDYLACCEYWQCEDNAMWEENRELHSSSVGACVAGLINVSDIVDVPGELITKGLKTLYDLFPNETPTRKTDLSLLSLIYPYNLLPKSASKLIIHNVETELLRSRGVIRYESDSYFSTLEKSFGRNQSPEFYNGSEAEWCFGLPWLALCNMELGNYDKAAEYIKITEEIMLEDGSLPELYYSNSKEHNENTPLLWANSLYIQAKEKYLGIS